MKRPPPVNRDCNRDPNIKALKRRGFTNHGSTLGLNRCLQQVLGVKKGGGHSPPNVSVLKRVAGLVFSVVGLGFRVS